MHSKVLVLSVAVAMLMVTACGASSSSSAGSPKSLPPGASIAGSVRIYRVTLSGGKVETPSGAPRGTGDAVIAFHGSSMVCWRFAHLHGFFNATFAHIHVGAKGKSGGIVVTLSTGPTLHHQGCVAVRGALLKAIERDPAGYYVNVQSRRYPSGAVRAQL